MRDCGGMKRGVVFWAWEEVSRGKTDYEHECEPREAQPFTRFFKIVKAKFIATREIVIEFVF
jgi:hypothetical protein